MILYHGGTDGVSTVMTANRNLLRMKYAKVVAAYAKRTGRSLDESLKRFYSSQAYELMREGVSDMHCMSIPYIVEEIIDGET